MADFFQGLIDFLEELFAALEEFLGTKSGSGSGFADMLGSIRDYIGASEAE